MGRLLSGLLLLNLLLACGEKLPEGIVPPEKMPALLEDMHLLDSKLSSQPLDSTRKVFYSAYEELFKYHGIDSVIFSESIQYYSTRPTKFREIYIQVTEGLQARINADEAMRAEVYQQRMIADSLALIRRQDSLYWVGVDSMKLKRIRHLLFNHEADSTIDEPQPYRFDSAFERLLENLGYPVGSFSDQWPVDEHMDEELEGPVEPQGEGLESLGPVDPRIQPNSTPEFRRPMQIE